jgi:hypothetical protein
LSITVQLLAVLWGIVAALWVQRRVHIYWATAGAWRQRFVDASLRLFIGILVFVAATTAVFPLAVLLNAILHNGI